MGLLLTVVLSDNIAFLTKCRKGVEIRPKDVSIIIIDTCSNFIQPVVDGREVKVWVHNVGPNDLQQFKSVLVARVRTGHDLFQPLEEVVNRQIAQTR